MAQVNWFFWVVVVFLFLWMIALVLVTYMTFCFPCIGCTAEGDIFCYRFKGRSRRSDIVNESLITKVRPMLRVYNPCILRTCADHTWIIISVAIM
jgi:hypothetical protein